MHEVPRFEEGHPVRDRHTHEQGRVDIIAGDMICVRWLSNKTEWLRRDDVEHVPGFRPKRRHRS